MTIRFGVVAITLGAAALCSAAACRQAAGVLFDIPPAAPPPAPQATSAPVVAPQDTARPPIEAVTAPDSVLALLPLHADGGLDWGAAIDGGTIRPRGAAPGVTGIRYLDGFAYDLILPGANKMFDAAFPHSRHVTWLTCQSCHPALVPPPGGKTSMAEINKGESCGVCHGPVAFSSGACSRCHLSMPSGNLTPAFDEGVLLARVADSTGGPAGGFAQATFQHWAHRIRYRCSACHPTLFELRAGADTLTMAALRNGEGCGACHDGRAAFGLAACERCHVAADGAP